MKKYYIKLIIPALCLVVSVLLLLTLITINQSDKLIEVKKGDTFFNIAQTLKENSIIKSKSLFILLVKLTGQSRNLKTGFYQFNKARNMYSIIKALTRGSIASRAITIPEGYNIFQIAGILDKKKIVKSNNFLRASGDRKILNKFNIKGNTAEGFLYPDTYYIPYNTPAEKIIEIKINNFFNHINSPYLEKMKNKYSSIEKAVILASLVEWEARTDFERPIIAGVFLNRIKKNMNLQSDATVCYAISKHNRRLFFKDYKTISPYNTYIHKGLPPTPICNPSEKSILAVIYPAKTDFLYFVSMRNKMHYFSSTYNQHLKAYRYFILNQRDINPFTL